MARKSTTSKENKHATEDTMIKSYLSCFKWVFYFPLFCFFFFFGGGGGGGGGSIWGVCMGHFVVSQEKKK
jgi:hypothetical protein